MTSANHDMPRPPPMRASRRAPARDDLDFIDEAVAGITDADVDERLRKALDQAGYRRRDDRDAHGASPARLAGAARKGASRFLLILAGAVPEIVDKAQGERARRKRLAGAILITSAMAVASMWFALTAVMGVAGLIAAPPALTWGLVIMAADRWLITSVPPDAARRRRAVVIPRLLLATLLGTLIATPLVLQTFQPQINAQITAIRLQETSSVSGLISLPFVRVRLGNSPSPLVYSFVYSWTAQVNGLQEITAFRGQVQVNTSADPELRALTARRTREIRQEQRYYHQWQCQLYGGRGCLAATGGPTTAKAAQNSYEQAAAQAADLAYDIRTRETKLTQEGTALIKKSAIIARYASELRVMVHDELLWQPDAQGKGSDLLTRLTALGQMVGNDPAAGAGCLLLFLLLLVTECLPVTIQLVHQPGDYERILAREIDMRVKITLMQERLKRQRQADGEEECLPPGWWEQDITPAQADSDPEPVTVPDDLRKEIESIFPFADLMEASKGTAPTYREELENCFMAISKGANELLRAGYDNDQIADALRITAEHGHPSAGRRAAGRAGEERTSLVRLNRRPSPHGHRLLPPGPGFRS